MNYWLVTSEYPPEFGGGISTYCLHTARMLQEKDWNVTIFVNDSKEKGIRETTEKKGIRIVRFNPNITKTNSNLGYETRLSYEFAHLIKLYLEKETIPDILESQEYNGIAYYILQFKHLKYAKFKNLKIIITLHAPSFLYLEYNKVSVFQHPYFWVGEMEKFCIIAADLLISPSKYLLSEIQSRFDISDKEVHIVENPFKVEGDFFFLPRVKNKFVFVGKLTPQKGCLELILFFKQLWEQGFNYKLVMVGGGNHLYHPEGIDMVDYIIKFFKNEISKQQLQLVGSINPNKLKDYTDSAQAIIIPSIVENLPYTVLEAMSNGKIVLASMQGGQSEIIENGIDGFLFDHNVPKSFKEAIDTINHISDEKTKFISNNAYKKIKNNYSYNMVYKKKKSVIDLLLERPIINDIFPFVCPKNIDLAYNLTKGIRGLLSIVIPYYNMKDYVEETIHSIVNSTYKNIEIILVNDGSTENSSIDILNNLQLRYSVKVFSKKNMGLALARNDGALMATGEFLAFLDPDDTVEPTYFEKSIEVLKNTKNVFFVGCWAKYFGESYGIWPTFNPEPPYLLVHNMINSSGLIYKKEAFIHAGLNDKRMIYGMEDYESVINMVKNGYQGVALPEPLWNYRIRKKSMSRSFTKEKQIYLYRLIANKHKDYYSTFGAEIANLLNANGPGINFDNPTKKHDYFGDLLFSSKVKGLIIKKIKSNPLLRKAAIKILSIYKNDT